MPSINTALRCTSRIAIAGLCSVLIAGCLPPSGAQSGDSSSIAGAVGTASPVAPVTSTTTTAPVDSTTTTAPVAVSPVTQCSGSGLAAIDLSGQCRVSAPTPGAFEAIDPSTLPIVVTWSPYSGSASGYIIYYGPTSTTATNLASDVTIGTANFDPAAPTVTYQAQDLGLSPGSAVCFQIFAYDTAHAIYNWSEVQCTVA